MNHRRPVFAARRTACLALLFLAALCPRIDATTVGYWRFENAAALLQDSGGNAAGPFDLTNEGGDNTNDALVLPSTGPGSAFPRVVPVVGLANLGAARFSPTETPADGFSTPHRAAFDYTNGFSIEAIVNLTSEPGIDQSRTIASVSNAATTEHMFRLFVAGRSSTSTTRPAPSLALSVRAINSTAGTAGTFTIYFSSTALLITPGQDFYVAATAQEIPGQGVQFTAYVRNLTTSGTLQISAPSPNATVARLVTGSSAPFRIGGAAGNVGELPWEGVIDEVRFSDTVLTRSELLIAIPPTPAVAPAITTQPVSQTATAGDNVSFTVAASGNPAPSIQWRRNGVNVPGAVSSTLTLAGVSAASAGSYTAVVSNSAGSVTTDAATLTVNPLAAPVISVQPVAQTIAGGTVVFSVVATGAPAPAYQWRKDGVNLVAGGTASTLVIQGANAAHAGNYSVVIANSLGSVTSGNAALVVTTSSDPGRLTNLSVLTDLTAAGQTFTIGTVIGGSGTSGTKPLVVRAVGPSLGALGVPATLDDPKLDVFAGQTVVATNDNWASDSTATTALTNAMASVGAFAFAGSTAKDAAVYLPTLAARDYTVQVSGVNGVTGTAIAEIYDATPSGAFTTATPRLTNVSVLKQINSGGSLTLGFTVGGATAKTVLIRVVGPGLAAVGLTSGALADPQLTLYNGSSVVVATNDDWGADSQLSSAGALVNAFAIGTTPSKDAMLIVTLSPGSYTAQAKAGTTGGLAIVEVYEVP